MKSKQSGFRFLGFVALADLFFGVSAGMLLLNPLVLTSEPAETTPIPPPRTVPMPVPPLRATEPAAAAKVEPDLRPIIRETLAEIQRTERELARLETDAIRLRQRAKEVLSKE